MHRHLILSILVGSLDLAGCSTNRAPHPEPTSTVQLRSASLPSDAPVPDPGSEWVTIREFAVPTPGATPHDPAYGPDGSLWFTEQTANKLGRLDPATGAIREWPLATLDSGPHGLTVDAAGNVWFTANSKGYLGVFDPARGGIVEYRMTDPRATDPHTPVLAADGRVWFTVQQSSFVGRLDPQTGLMHLMELPANAQPYGIVLAGGEVPYVCEFGSNKIARVDPVTLTVREYLLPDGARPRRLTEAPDGTIYYSDFARGKVGRLGPRTGALEEWPTPGGADSRPYAIAATHDGKIWFSESGVQPNTLVRFDPASSRFDVAIVPSGGGGVRNMVATPDGRLFLACSGANLVAIATPRQ